MQYIELDKTAIYNLLSFATQNVESQIIRVHPTYNEKQKHWCVFAQKHRDKIRLFNFTYDFAVQQIQNNSSNVSLTNKFNNEVIE